MEQYNIALIEACKSSNLPAAEKAIDDGANVNCKGNLGFTPLHIASYPGNVELAKMLIRRGADVNSKDNYGLTPLHMASQQGHLELVELLIENGANVNDIENNGTTPLVSALMTRNKEMVNLLLSKGANIDKNARDIVKFFGTPDIVNILKSWPSEQVIPVYRELAGTDIDPGLVADLHEYMGTKDIDYGGKRRRTNKRRTNKRRTNKRRTNKRRTNKRK